MCTIDTFSGGVWVAHVSGVTAPTHLLGREGRQRGDTIRGPDRRESGEARHGKSRPSKERERGLRASGPSLPVRPPPFWSQQTVDTFWLFWSFVQNELT